MQLNRNFVRLVRSGSEQTVRSYGCTRLIATSNSVPAMIKKYPGLMNVSRIPTFGFMRNVQTDSHDAAWAEQFKQATVGLASMDIDAITYKESAERMRTLLKTGLLKHADLHDNPERFFLAHRLLARHAPKLGPGFWIRFTVHYNLCVGTVLALGNAQQVEDLKGQSKIKNSDISANLF